MSNHEGYCSGAGCAACSHRTSGSLRACTDVKCGYLPDCAGNLALRNPPLDLDTIEAVVRSGGTLPGLPSVALALVARIRELEVEIGAQADCAPSSRSRPDLIKLLKKGVVMP